MAKNLVLDRVQIKLWSKTKV